MNSATYASPHPTRRATCGGRPLASLLHHLAQGQVPGSGRLARRGTRTLVAATIGATVVVCGVGSSSSASTTPARQQATSEVATVLSALKAGTVSGRVGSTLSIEGVAGAKAKMTLVKVIDPAKDVDQFPTGNRLLVAAIFKIVSTGTYYFPNADTSFLVKFIGSDGRIYGNGGGSQLIYNTGNVDIAGCTNFANESWTLAPGQSSVGCVVVEVPPGVTVTTVRYSDGGTVGQWRTS